VLVATSRTATSAFEVDVPIEQQTSSGAVAPFPAPASGAARVLLSLVFAFVGGILLNLMPCVLPVLSLKVLGFVRRSQSTGGGAFRHGLLFTGGVLVSFWLIVALLLVLRAGGQLLGWGFQFQNPAVVTITSLLFFLIGLNLFGTFEFGATLASIGAGAQARNESAPEARRAGWAGSFLSGFLATAVATPCTAPFMGSALGFALSQPVPVSFGVFTALALGMAAPYLLLSASPALIGRIPKPGPWMETLKQVMAFPMMGAVIWMISVLAALAGVGAALALLVSLLAAGLGAWIYGRWGGIARPLRSRVIAG
jgi:thiol:disulfide interchange protein DsbD